MLVLRCGLAGVVWYPMQAEALVLQPASGYQIMKITAIRKKWDENGSRAEFFWVKPTFER